MILCITVTCQNYLLGYFQTAKLICISSLPRKYHSSRSKMMLKIFLWCLSCAIFSSQPQFTLLILIIDYTELNFIPKVIPSRYEYMFQLGLICKITLPNSKINFNWKLMNQTSVGNGYWGAIALKVYAHRVVRACAFSNLASSVQTNIISYAFRVDWAFSAIASQVPK